MSGRSAYCLFYCRRFIGGPRRQQFRTSGWQAGSNLSFAKSLDNSCQIPRKWDNSPYSNEFHRIMRRMGPGSVFKCVSAGAGVKTHETSFRALISPGSTRDRRLVVRAGFAFAGTACGIVLQEVRKHCPNGILAKDSYWSRYGKCNDFQCVRTFW